MGGGSGERRAARTRGGPPAPAAAPPEPRPKRRRTAPAPPAAEGAGGGAPPAAAVVAGQGGTAVVVVLHRGAATGYGAADGAVRLCVSGEEEEGAEEGAGAFTCAAVLEDGLGPDAERTLVLGTAGGALRAFRLADGGPAWTSEPLHDGPVTGVRVLNAAEGLLVSAAGAGLAVVDAAAGAAVSRLACPGGPAACLAVSPDGGTVAVGGATLALVDTATGKEVCSTSVEGVEGPLGAVAFSADGRYLAAAGRGGSTVHVLEQVTSRRKSQLVARGSLDLGAEVAQLEALGAGADAMQIAALHADGTLAVVEVGAAQLQGKAEDGSGIQVAETFAFPRTGRARKGAKAEEKVAAFGAALTADGNWEFTIACGSSAAPKFAMHTWAPGEDSGEEEEEGSEEEAAAIEPAANEPEAPKANGVHHGPSSDEEAPAGAAGAGPAANGVGGTAPAAAGVAGVAAAALAKAYVQPPKAGKITAASLQTALSQALQSDNRALLEQCFNVSDAKVIDTTVRQIASDDSVRLLAVLVDRLQQTPVRAGQLNAWLKAVMKSHTAYLMTSPAAQPCLQKLHQMVDQRVAIYRQMSALAGRLELLVSLERLKQQAAEGTAMVPLAVYNDGESEDGQEDSDDESEISAMELEEEDFSDSSDE